MLPVCCSLINILLYQYMNTYLLVEKEECVSCVSCVCCNSRNLFKNNPQAISYAFLLIINKHCEFPYYNAYQLRRMNKIKIK